jgi:LysR family transcriptional regulator, low CO2-responsive transcriptional regulator
MTQAPDIRRYLKHGTLTQMRAFEAATRLGSLTRAAEQLHMAQATASVQIKKLAETVGLVLFEYTGRQICLTAAGERVYAGCGEVFRALSAMEEGLSELRGAASGRLDLAVSSSAHYFSSRLLQAFLARHPGVHASLQVRDRLALDDHDLCMVIEPPEAPEVVAQAVVPNPLVVLAHAAHPLALEQDIPFERLAAEPFLLRETGCGTRVIALRLFARHGVAPRIRMEFSSDEALREAVGAGLGIAVLPRYAPGANGAAPRLVCLDVEGFPLESHWHFVYPVGRRLSGAARAFMDFARLEAKGLFRECLLAQA